MFKNLSDEINALNSDVKNVANCEKAKKLRKKLLTIGLLLAIIGFGGVFVCFVLFATAGTDGFSGSGFSARVMVPFLLFIPFAVVGCIGTTLASYGFKIVIVGYSANLIEETIGNVCPKCKDKIEENEIFCSKCGTKVKKQCPHCNTINGIKDQYCRKCGTKLD